MEVKKERVAVMPDDIAKGFSICAEDEYHRCGTFEMKATGEDTAMLKMSISNSCIYVEKGNPLEVIINLKIKEMNKGAPHTFRHARHSFYRLTGAIELIEFFMQEIYDRGLDNFCEALDFEIKNNYKTIFPWGG